MSISFKKREKVIRVPILVIDREEIEVDSDFPHIIEEICKSDKYFAVEGVATIPWVKELIDLGWIIHSQGRGCYASDKMRKRRKEIIDAFYELYGD